MLIDELVGLALDGIADHIDCIIAGSDKLSAEQARRFGHELAALPPLDDVRDKLNVGERYWGLNAIADHAKSGSQFSQPPGFMGSTIGVPRWTPNRAVDWDIALRTINQWMDRMARINIKDSQSTRRDAMSKIDADQRELNAELRMAMFHPLRCTKGALSESVANSLVLELTPGTLAIFNAQVRGAERRDMSRVALALAAYRAEHGQYPAVLSNLEFYGYLDPVPPDPFSGSQLHYLPKNSGFLLWGADADGSDPPLDTTAADPLEFRIGISVPLQ